MAYLTGAARICIAAAVERYDLAADRFRRWVEDGVRAGRLSLPARPQTIRGRSCTPNGATECPRNGVGCDPPPDVFRRGTTSDESAGGRGSPACHIGLHPDR